MDKHPPAANETWMPTTK